MVSGSDLAVAGAALGGAYLLSRGGGGGGRTRPRLPPVLPGGGGGPTVIPLTQGADPSAFLDAIRRQNQVITELAARVEEGRDRTVNIFEQAGDGYTPTRTSGGGVNRSSAPEAQGANVFLEAARGAGDAAAAVASAPSGAVEFAGRSGATIGSAWDLLTTGETVVGESEFTTKPRGVRRLYEPGTGLVPGFQPEKGDFIPGSGAWLPDDLFSVNRNPVLPNTETSIYRRVGD